ncbi:hypothetical protein [Halobacteriovorax sp. HLS]|uniref:hypothetical protein n=1 Tax=Halobacteriovorax sp. HLS TaxID=2234000 RepID=UPI000FD71F63|nr:hypothetical protein [Halobacteriovorax sp. HLS]
MKYFTQIIFLFYSLSISADYSLEENYRLIKDKSFFERSLHNSLYESYLDLDITATIDGYTLSQDINEISSSSKTSTEKEAAVLALLNENQSTQNFVELNSAFAIPLPSINIKKYRLTSSLFYSLNLSSLFAISTFDSATSPSTKVYMNKETRAGVSTIITHQDKRESFWKLNLFYSRKDDTLINQSVNDLLRNTKIYDFGTLNKGESNLSADLLWNTKNIHRTIKLEVYDLDLIDLSSQKALTFSSTPLLHLFYQRHTKSLKDYRFEFFGGLHYRDEVPLLDGLYIGSWFYSQRSSFRTSISVSKSFLSVVPEYKGDRFFINYKFKLSYLGKRDGFKTPIIHTLSSGITF